MSQDKQSSPSNQNPSQQNITASDMAALIEAVKSNNGSDLKSLIESIRDMTPARKVLYADFKPKSPFNPTGSRSRALSRTVYQNGSRVNVSLLFDEEIKLLGELMPGRYIDKLVTIRIVEGSNGALDQVHIEYANKSHDQRLAMSSRVRSFTSLLRQCLDEHKAAGVVAKAA